jgi:hypothetical protein
VRQRDRDAIAVATLRECRAALAARGSTVVGEAIGNDAGDTVDWLHYPPGEVYDAVSHLQYFYHRHPHAAGSAAADAAEHGHFHLFLRGEGMPAGVVPMLSPETAVANAPPPRRSAPQSAPLKRGGSEEVCHLVAIAVDGRGEPVRLFTTNRWVTGESWYRGADVTQMLDQLRLGGRGGRSVLDRWIEAVLCLYRSEIAALLQARDKAIGEWRWRWPRSHALEDARLEITSSRAIDLEARLAAVEIAAARPPRTSRRPPLPTMADGWGS